MSGRVAVLIPTLDEEAAIGECLERVLAQTAPPDEVVVADGGSVDRTVAIVEEVARRSAPLRISVVPNPGRRQSAGLNRALAAVDADVVVRLDARSFVAPDYVARCVDVLDGTGAAVVGGRMVARRGDGVVEHGIALANGARWGAGPARFHRDAEPGPTETVYLGTFRRSWLDRVGGWAEDVGVNEDYELNHRIREAGGVVWFDPALEVGYQPRRTFTALARQYARYGSSKAVVVRRHPRSLRLRQALPALLVPALVLALAGRGPLRTAGRLALVAHLATVVAGAARASRVDEPAPAPVRAAGGAAAATMHWCWALGFWRTLLRGRTRC